MVSHRFRWSLARAPGGAAGRGVGGRADRGARVALDAGRRLGLSLVGAALSGYMVLAAGVALAAAWHLRGMGFGVANQITLLRSGLVCLVGGALLAGGHAPSASWSLAAIIGIALGLDALDGWLARRLGLASRFGARFDLEIDALLILILAVLAWQTGRVGAWVLVIGGMRYGFAALGMIWPAPAAAAAEPPAQGGVRLLGVPVADLPAAADPGMAGRLCRRAGARRPAGILRDRHRLARPPRGSHGDGAGGARLIDTRFASYSAAPPPPVGGRRRMARARSDDPR